MKNILLGSLFCLIISSCNKEQTQGSLEINNVNMNKEIGTTTGANVKLGGNISENANTEFVTEVDKSSPENNIPAPDLKDVKNYSVPHSENKIILDSTSAASKYNSIEPKGPVKK